LVIGPAFGGRLAESGESIELGGLGLEGGAVGVFVAMSVKGVTKFLGESGVISVGETDRPVGGVIRKIRKTVGEGVVQSIRVGKLGRRLGFGRHHLEVTEHGGQFFSAVRIGDGQVGADVAFADERGEGDPKGLFLGGFPTVVHGDG